MTEGDAIAAAESIGVADGDTITIQSDGQASHPHSSAGTPTEHVDGWEVTNNGGTYTAQKMHAY